MKDECNHDQAYLEHIIDSINAVEAFLENTTKDDFFSSRLKQSAVVREIEIIGEAVKNLSSSLKHKYPKIRWKEIAGTRDIMIHHYFGVDLNIVWNIAASDLPNLKKQVLIVKRD